MKLPRLYPILDIETMRRCSVDLREAACVLAGAGVDIVQLRDKQGAPQRILEHAGVITEAFSGSRCTLVMNDRVDLALLAGWLAVHVGHTDMPPEAVRQTAADVTLMVGMSTHNDAQVQAADEGTADYVAIGPVFGTSTKADAEPVVGLEGVRRARKLTQKPLVAIGGIRPENAAAVIEAGADSVAVIGSLFSGVQGLETSVRDFLRRLR